MRDVCSLAINALAISALADASRTGLPETWIQARPSARTRQEGVISIHRCRQSTRSLWQSHSPRTPRWEADRMWAVRIHAKQDMRTKQVPRDRHRHHPARPQPANRASDHPRAANRRRQRGLRHRRRRRNLWQGPSLKSTPPDGPPRRALRGRHPEAQLAVELVLEYAAVRPDHLRGRDVVRVAGD